MKKENKKELVEQITEDQVEENEGMNRREMLAGALGGLGAVFLFGHSQLNPGFNQVLFCAQEIL